MENELIELVNYLGAPTVIFILLTVLGVFYLQRDRIKNAVWEFVLEMGDDVQEYIHDELTGENTVSKEWLYTFYDNIPKQLKVFMSRKAYEKIVDKYMQKLTDSIFEEYKKP